MDVGAESRPITVMVTNKLQQRTMEDRLLVPQLKDSNTKANSFKGKRVNLLDFQTPDSHGSIVSIDRELIHYYDIYKKIWTHVLPQIIMKKGSTVTFHLEALTITTLPQKALHKMINERNACSSQ